MKTLDLEFAVLLSDMEAFRFRTSITTDTIPADAAVVIIENTGAHKWRVWPLIEVIDPRSHSTTELPENKR